MTIANNTVLYIWKLLRMKFPSWFIYFITGSLYLLIPFTHFIPVPPSSDNNQSVLWSVSLSLFFFNLSFKFYLFTCGYAESSLLTWAFSSCSKGGYSSFLCTGFSLWWLLLLLHEGSGVVVCELSCLLTCGIFLDEGLNPCLLHWQVDS